MQEHTPHTLMAIGADHDDNEIWGCTLDLYRRAGWRVVSCVMADGRFIPEGIVNP